MRYLHRALHRACTCCCQVILHRLCAEMLRLTARALPRARALAGTARTARAQSTEKAAAAAETAAHETVRPRAVGVEMGKKRTGYTRYAVAGGLVGLIAYRE